MTNKSIMICLIHCENNARLEKLRPCLQALANKIGANIIEIFKQPEIKPAPLYQCLKREAIFSALEYKQKIYTNAAKQSILEHAWQSLKTIWHRYAASAPKSTAARMRIHIERILTLKHIQAWKNALDNCEYVIVFEDDATFVEQSFEKFEKLLHLAGNCDKNEPFYLNLAGGFPLETINANKFISFSGEDHVELSQPLTNTTCSYMLNQQAVRLFCEILSKKPWYEDANADWLTNGIILYLHKKNLFLRCWHAYPPVFLHGSMSGLFKSSISYSV